MKLLIEATSVHLFLCLIKNNETVAFKLFKNLKHKSENLADLVEDVLAQGQGDIWDIADFYVTTGPGSFMSSRASLMFVRTICQITHANLFTLDTLSFIAGGKKGTYFIKAGGSKSFKGHLDKKMVISLVDVQPSSTINYEKIIHQPETYCNLFSLETDLQKVEPIYGKDPTIS